MESLRLQKLLANPPCNTEFANENDQKNHYKSEWPRYKNKIVGVPGATTEALFLTRQATLAKEKKLNAPSKLYNCGPCGKGFGSYEAYAQHRNSQSHILKLDRRYKSQSQITRKPTPAKENSKLNAPSKVYTCGLCGKGFGSSEAHAQHLNSQSHIRRMVPDGHLNESTPIVKTLAPHMINKLSQNKDEFDDVSDESDEWEEVDESDEWEVVDGSDEWEEVDVSAMNVRRMTNK